MHQGRLCVWSLTFNGIAFENNVNIQEYNCCEQYMMSNKARHFGDEEANRKVRRKGQSFHTIEKDVLNGVE
jgi:hypothetical protein